MTHQNYLLLTLICASLHDISHSTVPYPPASCASIVVYSHSTELLSIHSTCNTVPVNHPTAIANSKNYRMYGGFIIGANHWISHLHKYRIATKFRRVKFSWKLFWLSFIFLDSNWHYQWCNINLIFSQIETFTTANVLVDFWRQSYEQRNWMDSECTSMPVVYGVSKYLDRHHRLRLLSIMIIT